MLIIGLTGSIAAGKSTAAAGFRRLGVPVQDADAVVHRLTGPGGAAVAPIDAAFPGVVRDGAVDRAALGAIVFADRAALTRLEQILHPMVAAERGLFLRRAALSGARLVVLDVPLLFEAGVDRECDLIVTLTISPPIQAVRVLKRPGMTRARLRAIRARQMPDAEKARRADIVVPTGLGRRPVLAILQALVTLCPRVAGRRRRWPPGPLPRFAQKPWHPRRR